MSSCVPHENLPSAEVSASVAISWCLENPFNAQTQTGRLHLNAIPGERHLVTTIFRFLEINTELVLLDYPFADSLLSVCIASQRAVTVVDVAPMHFVSELQSGDFCADLTARKLLYAFGR